MYTAAAKKKTEKCNARVNTRDLVFQPANATAPAENTVPFILSAFNPFQDSPSCSSIFAFLFLFIFTLLLFFALSEFLLPTRPRPHTYANICTRVYKHMQGYGRNTKPTFIAHNERTWAHHSLCPVSSGPSILRIEKPHTPDKPGDAGSTRGCEKESHWRNIFKRVFGTRELYIFYSFSISVFFFFLHWL